MKLQKNCNRESGLCYITITNQMTYLKQAKQYDNNMIPDIFKGEGYSDEKVSKIRLTISVATNCWFFKDGYETITLNRKKR